MYEDMIGERVRIVEVRNQRDMSSHDITKFVGEVGVLKGLYRLEEEFRGEPPEYVACRIEFDNPGSLGDFVSRAQKSNGSFYLFCAILEPEYVVVDKSNLNSLSRR